MSFQTDKQTLNDLDLLGRHGGDSIYGIFNQTHTRGGAYLLTGMFEHPLSEAATINQRSTIIRYFTSAGLSFPFESGLFDAAEQYLSNKDEPGGGATMDLGGSHKATHSLSY